jgi:hypothetical protein
MPEFEKSRGVTLAPEPAEGPCLTVDLAEQFASENCRVERGIYDDDF